jgi:hypothetical protein
MPLRSLTFVRCSDETCPVRGYPSCIRAVAGLSPQAVLVAALAPAPVRCWNRRRRASERKGPIVRLTIRPAMALEARLVVIVSAEFVTEEQAAAVAPRLQLAIHDRQRLAAKRTACCRVEVSASVSQSRHGWLPGCANKTTLSRFGRLVTCEAD